MPIRAPELTVDRIARWLREAAPIETPEVSPERPALGALSFRNHPGFDFKKAKRALQRARTKSDLKIIRPLRGLRRDQEAVNEGLIDALSALISVNKDMAAEVEALSRDVSNLRRQLAEREASAETRRNGPPPITR